MQKIILLLICLTSACLVHAQQVKQPRTKAGSKSKKQGDKVRQYFFVMLTSGANRDHDSAAASALQQAHMDNINKLYYAGKLKVAGPFSDNGNWRGIFIFDCASKEEVETLVKADPAVAAGRLA